MWDVAHAVKRAETMDILRDFFYRCRGRAVAFRFKDHTDFKSCGSKDTITALDQLIATGDGVTTAWYLTKTYGSGSNSYAREINKPVVGTVLVAVDGVVKTEGTHYTIDYDGGVLQFLAGNIPAASAAVTAGFEFDVPCRFDVDEMHVTSETYDAYTWGQIPVVELKLSFYSIESVMYADDILETFVNIEYPQDVEDL
jgi:uncharacterized protein (TIGR02217 family)